MLSWSCQHSWLQVAFKDLLKLYSSTPGANWKQLPGRWSRIKKSNILRENEGVWNFKQRQFYRYTCRKKVAFNLQLAFSEFNATQVPSESAVCKLIQLKSIFESCHRTVSSSSSSSLYEKHLPWVSPCQDLSQVLWQLVRSKQCMI